MYFFSVFVIRCCDCALGRHDGGHTFVHVQLLMAAELRYFWHQTALSEIMWPLRRPVKIRSLPELVPNRRYSGKQQTSAKFLNCSNGRTWLNLQRTTNEEISDVGLVNGCSVMRDCEHEIFSSTFRIIGRPFNLFLQFASVVCMDDSHLDLDSTLTKRRQSHFSTTNTQNC